MADADIELLRSEIQRLAVDGKQIVERHKADKMAYGQMGLRLDELRGHEKELFTELVGQVTCRTVNNCYQSQIS